MIWKPEIDRSLIAILGSFNPAIFHPLWFKMNKLIRDDEADGAKLNITHSDVSDFSIDWFQLIVLKDRYTISSTDNAHFEPMRDLVIGNFTILEHTPVSKLALIRQMHFKMPSIEKWHSFGHLIAPKEIWKGKMKKPGLRSIIIEDSIENPEGSFIVKIDPSTKVTPGVYIEVIHHYDKIKESKAENMIKLLKDRFIDDINSSLDTAEYLLSQEY